MTRKETLSGLQRDVQSAPKADRLRIYVEIRWNGLASRSRERKTDASDRGLGKTR
jgi:hypothetical protein